MVKGPGGWGWVQECSSSTHGHGTHTTRRSTEKHSHSTNEKCRTTLPRPWNHYGLLCHTPSPRRRLWNEVSTMKLKLRKKPSLEHLAESHTREFHFQHLLLSECCSIGKSGVAPHSRFECPCITMYSSNNMPTPEWLNCKINPPISATRHRIAASATLHYKGRTPSYCTKGCLRY